MLALSPRHSLKKNQAMMVLEQSVRKQTDRQTERQTDGQTDKDTHTHTHKHTHKHTHAHTHTHTNKQTHENPNKYIVEALFRSGRNKHYYGSVLSPSLSLSLIMNF